MNYTFMYILCIFHVLFYINVFHKINKIYYKTLHCIFFFFLNHYIKMKEVFFPKKCSPAIIFTKKKKSYQKNRTTHRPITILYI